MNTNALNVSFAEVSSHEEDYGEESELFVGYEYEGYGRMFIKCGCGWRVENDEEYEKRVKMEMENARREKERKERKERITIGDDYCVYDVDGDVIMDICPELDVSNQPIGSVENFHRVLASSSDAQENAEVEWMF